MLPLFLAIFLASFFQGLSGFGFGLVATPILLFFLPLPDTIFLVGFSAFLDIPVGLYVINFIPMSILKIVLGIFLLFFLTLLILDYKKSLPSTWKHLFPVGFSSGFLGGTLAMGGHPLALFYANKSASQMVFKANLMIYFLVLNIVFLCIFPFFHRFSHFNILWASTGVLGAFLGIFLAKKLSHSHFEKVVYVGIFYSAVFVLGNGFAFW